MSEITKDTDWGAQGAKLTGAQVQSFIKGELNKLNQQCYAVSSQQGSMRAAIDAMNSIIQSSLHCRIAYVDKDDKKFKVCLSHEWQNLAYAGHFAVGVVVMAEGIAPKIVSLTGEALPWGGDNASSGTGPATEVETYSDYEGKQHTDSLINDDGHDLYGPNQAEWTSFAAPWCAHYTCVTEIGDDSYGCFGGFWHLPSVGELSLLSKYRMAINHCLKLIDGATPLPSGSYWSSNAGGGRIMCVNTEIGEVEMETYYDKTLFVRPMANFSLIRKTY